MVITTKTVILTNLIIATHRCNFNPFTVVSTTHFVGYNNHYGYINFYFLLCALRCSSPLIKQVFRQSLCCCSSFVGFNSKYSMKYIKFYTVTDTFKAAVVRDMRLAAPFLSVSQVVSEDIIKSLSSA